MQEEADTTEKDSLKFDDCEDYYPIDYVDPINIDDHHCSRMVVLRGPHNPLVAQVHSVLSNNEETITIDAHSVNSVFLTSMQQVYFECKQF